MITLLLIITTVDAVTLTGSSEYAVPGTEFTLKCDVPEEANAVQFYRRPDVTTSVGSVQVASGQCYNTIVNPAVTCTAGVCSCVTSGGNVGTVFRLIIQPQTGDQGSVWFCRRINLPNTDLDSDDYTLNLAAKPSNIALTPPDTTYIRTEGDTLPDITCTADCRPGCTFVWTRPDNTNFTVSPVLSLGQLDRSEHGTYRCTARNDVGESTKSTSVTIEYGPSAVSLTPPTVTYTPTEGQTIPTITCSADCNPACTYSWTKDGQSYRTGSGLQLTNIQRGQTGVYRCTASNVHGSDVSVNINVIVDFGPNITLLPSNNTYTRTEGDMLPNITCTADCRPDCNFVWARPDNTNFTVSPVLSLGQLDRSEDGTYQCNARNDVGESTASISVTIKYAPGSSIALSPPDTTYTRTEGDTLPDITCTADCRPDCTFVWTRPDNTNFTVSHVLSLGQLDRSEHGTYRCTARNDAGESTKSTSVTIEYLPSSVSLTPPTVTYTPTEGQTIPTITCSADCNPACTYSWTKDGQSYRTGSGLELSNIQRGQTGVYTCAASNVYGSAAAVDVSITVYYGPGTALALSPPDTTYTRTEGDTLPDITCTADCRPNCTFVWTRPDNTNFTVSPVLSLGQLNRSEHGTYRCTARNIVGNSTISTTVTVQFPPSILNVTYNTLNGNITEGNTTALFCYVTSVPPSTIQWFYQDNGTVLLTSPDVLESTYTLTNAGCLDTGIYTCSVRNNISTTAVTRDVPINVLCKPREDPRTQIGHKLGLPTAENLTLNAQFLANPMPSFSWEFRNTSFNNTTTLVNGTGNFLTYSSYILTNLSAVSVGIRTNIHEHWYGMYDITATNSQGSGRISFIVEAQGKPNSPYGGTVHCPYENQAILNWRSAFDGGSTQTFVIGKRSHVHDATVIVQRSDIPDPGQNQLINISISGLDAGTQHFFIVYAVNIFGNSTMENEVNCTTKASSNADASSLGPLPGAVGGSLSAVIVGVIISVIVIARKRKDGGNKRDDDTEMITGEVSTTDSSDGQKPNVLYESSDGLKANILYETSEPQPSSSSEYAVVQKKSKPKSVSPNDVYAVVAKSKMEDAETKNDVYAEVVKKKEGMQDEKGRNAGKAGKGEKKGKGKQKKGGAKQRDDVYENVDSIGGAKKNINSNCQEGASPVLDKEPSRKMNKDGLIYLDIEFKEDKKNGRNYVIHGIENRTDYADVDFTKHANPLPSDDEDSTHKGAGILN